jgi:sulfatase maturation enzyme AslB (radical SAM superfamily)
MAYPVGNTKFKTLEAIYRDAPMRELRKDMLNERTNPACGRCYEQEQSGFFSGRKSANKHHGHHVKRIDDDRFQMSYWDIRFSNLCNLSCRSCGHIFSSSLYQDQARLAGGDWKDRNQVLNYAGRTETDMWEQLIPHLDYVEQIYFAGGEPLMMKDHYNILDELERRERFDVRLIYNTNFTQIRLKDRTVFDYWKRFKSVAVGASLDAMGPRAEYIRKGTKWDQIVRNREQMLKQCPNVDFYVSSTVSIYNVMHVMDFHRSWVEQGLIAAADWNINILQGPDRDRIDVLPLAYKEQVKEKILAHIEWLKPQDKLKRAIVGYESILKYMFDDDKSWLLHEFFSVNDKSDAYRKESFEAVFPEYKDLRTYCYDKWTKK